MYDVGSLPGGFELVMTFLLESQYKVSFGEGPVAHSTAVIVAEALLINSGAGDVSSIVEEIDGVFKCCSRGSLAVRDDSWHVEANFGW